MPSAITKYLVTLITTGGLASGTALGVINASKGNRGNILQTQSSSLISQEDSLNLDSGDFQLTRLEEAQDSGKVEVVTEGSDRASVLPKDQLEVQQEKDSLGDESSKNPLGQMAQPEVMVPKEVKSSMQVSPPSLPEEENVILEDQQVKNGGYYLLELDEEDLSFDTDEWSISHCKKDEKYGKVIFSCPWNYKNDGRRIDFYINSDTVTSKKLDWDELTELLWTPYGGNRSGLTLTFGSRNLIVELEKGPKD